MVLTVIIGIIILSLIIIINNKRPKFSNKKFKALEKELLIEFYELFDTEIQNKLKAQIQYFEPKRKWRQYWEKSMSLELYGNTDNPLSNDLRFNRKSESKLATIYFKALDQKHTVEFNSFDGRLWGWKIRPNPKSVMKLNLIEVTSKKINNDPNQFVQSTYKKELNESIPKFNGWINEISNLTKIKESYHPIKNENLDNYLKLIDSKLPVDYLDLIKQTEGVECEEFSILGLSEIYSTGLDDGNYYHLAEFEDGIIAVKEGEKSGNIYYCSYYGLISELGFNFSEIIIEKFKEKEY